MERGYVNSVPELKNGNEMNPPKIFEPSSVHYNRINSSKELAHTGKNIARCREMNRV
jgi:hypothetical protein